MTDKQPIGRVEDHPEREQLTAWVQIPIGIPPTDQILTALREQIPQILRADVHREISMLYAKGFFETQVRENAQESFKNWLSRRGPDGMTQEEAIIARFHHFMTEEVAGPRTRRDYLLKVLLTEHPQLVEKMLGVPSKERGELHAQISELKDEVSQLWSKINSMLGD